MKRDIAGRIDRELLKLRELLENAYSCERDITHFFLPRPRKSTETGALSPLETGGPTTHTVVTFFITHNNEHSLADDAQVRSKTSTRPVSVEHLIASIRNGAEYPRNPVARF